jgi:tol-pal system protein YbgF
LSAKAFRLAVAAGTLLALSGCVTVPEFQSLRRRVDQIEKGGGAHGGGAAEGEWAKASGGGASSGTSGSRLADLDAEVQSLRDEVSKLQGDVQSLQRELDQVKGKSSGNPAAGAASVSGAAAAPAGAAAAGAAVAAPSASSANPTPANPTPAPTGPATAGTASSEEVRDYETAFGLYRAGKYADAIDRFQAFLQTHPSSEFADNALFWMGESYFKLNDFEQAAVAFDRVVKRFPNGNKVPDALYRQGVSLQEIGSRTGQQSTYGPAACQIFKRIADDYPNSERVAEARRQLEKCPS